MFEDPTEIGHWRFIQRLGAGGFGVVNLWRNVQTKQQVAIKKCHVQPHLSEEGSKQKERWTMEVDLMKNKIRHENIVKFFEVDAEFLEELNKTNPSRLPLLCMEYCQGGDLRKLLSLIQNINGLPERDVRNVLKSLRNAIEYLHSQGITHRDIKPENIVFHSINSENVYKLTDLGYAKLINQNTIDASLVGTFGYFAPEIIMTGRYTRTVDYWSFGVIAFEIICGCRPFIPHREVQKYIVQIKKKTSAHIAITENNVPGDYRKHTQLFRENQISNCLKEMLTKWFQLALETDPKQRGSEFVKSTESPDGVPINTLKIFTELDEVLSANILTIFCLFSYQYLSYKVTNTLTMAELFNNITKDTKIPLNEIYIILPHEQCNIEDITLLTKPIDLVIENLYDSPMLYISRLRHTIGQIQPVFSEVLENVLKNPKQPMYNWYLIQFAKQSLFFVKNEQRLYKTFLNGLKDYGEYLNHQIVKFKANVLTVSRQIIKLTGSISLHITSLKHSLEKLKENQIECVYVNEIANWEDTSGRLDSNIEKLNDAISALVKRYESVLRRSSADIKSPLFTEADSLNLNKFEKDYEKMMATQIKSRNDTMFSMLCENLKERDALLYSPSLIRLQESLSEIHVEFNLIKEAIQNAVVNIEKYSIEISQVHKMYLDDFYKIIENATKECNKRNAQIFDIDNIMDAIHMDSINSLPDVMHIGNEQGMDLSSFGESNDTKTLIEDNCIILEATQSLLSDIEMNVMMN